MAKHRSSFSVVIPTYNRQAHTERAVQSCLAQTEGPLEVIVVDDHSAEQFIWSGDPSVRVIRHERNFGGGRARNTGIDSAHGDFVCFLDSDDVWKPGKLAEVRRFLDACGSTDDLVVFHDMIIVEKAKSRRFRNPPVKEGEDILSYFFLRHGLAQTSTLCVPRALAQRVRFNDTLRIHQDLEFCHSLQKAGGRFRLIPLPLAEWHWGGHDRVSETAGSSASLAWSRSLRGRVSEKTYWAVQAYSAAPCLRASNPEAALACVISAWRVGALGPMRVLRRLWRLDFMNVGGLRMIWRALIQSPRPTPELID